MGGEALDGAAKAHNHLPDFFASVQKGLQEIKFFGSRRWTAAASSAWFCRG